MLTISEIFDLVAKTHNRLEAAEVLKKYKSPAILLILNVAFGDQQPFPKFDYKNTHTVAGVNHMFHGSNYFNLKLKSITDGSFTIDKRVHALCGFLSNLYYLDADIVYRAFTGKFSAHRITPSVVRLAFPGLIPEKKENGSLN